MGSTIYDGDLMALKEHAPFGSGECVALPQALTDIGHTSKWRPGMRVMDLEFLPSGTVIANFKIKEGFLQRFPNQHGYHVSFFMGFSPLRASTGEPLGIIVMDQWRGRRVLPRTIKSYADAEAKRMRISPCDNANEFYVVMK
jgi:hypothetical protein